MPKRPLPITIIGWLFIAASIVGFVYHANEINIHNLFGNDVHLALLVRILAIVGGIFLLRGADWARYLLAVWLLYHVILSIFHPIEQLIMHSILLIVITFFLFRPKANEYFKNKSHSESNGSPS
jgi:hypothetical protein